MTDRVLFYKTWSHIDLREKPGRNRGDVSGGVTVYEPKEATAGIVIYERWGIGRTRESRFE
jgi:hypothetical protein